MRVLGIETSCDETAAAVVEDGKRLLGNVVASSMDLHVQYGGVVPEVAARSHIEAIIPVVNQALSDAACIWDDIDAIAVTYGAGLGGSLLIGVLTARTLAITHNKPLYGINHVESHVYANFLTQTSLPGYAMRTSQPEFPMLAIIVSGGHSQLALFRDHFDYTLLGQTQDDAIGEAFDKVAKILGLPYPGGPSIAKAAALGNDHAYSFPKAKLTGANPALEKLRSEMKTANAFRSDAPHGDSEAQTEPYTKYGEGALELATQQSAESAGRVLGSAQKPASVAKGVCYDFSFSGLKTAVLRRAQAEIGEDYSFPSFKLSERLSEAQKHDIAASFERIALETIVDKAKMAYEEFVPRSVVIAGGVAASQVLRRQLSAALPMPIEYPDFKLCTDNGAMIATLGCFKAIHKQPVVDPYTLAINPNLSM